MDQNILKKKLLYRSKNRGCRETDLILGKFAENFLDEMDNNELKDFEKILEENDSDIYKWLGYKKAAPSYINSKIMQKLLNFKIKE